MNAERNPARAPRWVLVLFVLLVGMAASPVEWGTVRRVWDVLSLAFLLLPFVAFGLYVWARRRSDEKPSFRGYWEFLRVVGRVRRGAYRGVARMLLSRDASRIAVAVLAWCVILLVFLVRHGGLLRSLFG